MTAEINPTNTDNRYQDASTIQNYFNTYDTDCPFTRRLPHIKHQLHCHNNTTNYDHPNELMIAIKIGCGSRLNRNAGGKCNTSSLQ